MQSYTINCDFESCKSSRIFLAANTLFFSHELHEFARMVTTHLRKSVKFVSSVCLKTAETTKNHPARKFFLADNECDVIFFRLFHSVLLIIKKNIVPLQHQFSACKKWKTSIIFVDRKMLVTFLKPFWGRSGTGVHTHTVLCLAARGCSGCFFPQGFLARDF